MKKLSYILLVAVAAFAAACQKHGTLQESEEEPWLYDMTLPVPIQFGSSAPMTKAIVEGTELPLDARVGIFSYNKADGLDLSADNLLLNNEEVSVGSGNSLTFVNGEKYYPLESKMYFSFSGYYPYNEGGIVTLTASKISETGSLYQYFGGGPDPMSGQAVFGTKFNLGYDDIIWGESVATRTPGGVDGFNAKYIRSLKREEKDGLIPADKASGYKPSLGFQHLLTAIRFNVVADDESDNSNVTVTGFRVKNIPLTAFLIVASKDGNYPGGTIKFGKAVASNTISITDDGTASGKKTLNFTPTKDGKEIGVLLLAPQKSYECELDVKDPNGKLHTSKFTITNASEFESGKIYNLSAKVYDYVVVDVTYTLKEWTPGVGEITFEKSDGTSGPELEIG